MIVVEPMFIAIVGVWREPTNSEHCLHENVKIKVHFKWLKDHPLFGMGEEMVVSL
jgi:hypothetical protein